MVKDFISTYRSFKVNLRMYKDLLVAQEEKEATAFGINESKGCSVELDSPGKISIKDEFVMMEIPSKKPSHKRNIGRTPYVYSPSVRNQSKVSHDHKTSTVPR